MLRVLFFIFIVIVSTTVGALSVIVVGLLKKYSAFSHRYIIRPWAKIVLWAAGTKVDVKGLENIAAGQPYIIMSNHQSHMDIPVLLAHVPLKMTIITKKELFKIPIFGQGMRAFGMLEIDRSNRSRAIETLRQASKIIRDQKISVLAFPEGTRSEDGSLQPFKKGPIMLAIETKVPVLAVSVQGTFPILPKKQLRVRPGRVRLVIHPPIEVNNYTVENRNQLMQKIHKTVAEGLYETEREFS